MSARSLNVSADCNVKSVRVPPLPGRHDIDEPAVDVHSDAYKAGYNDASREFLAQIEEHKARHEELTSRFGELLAEMDARYRREALSLVERLFAAAAPTLARRSSLVDIMKLIEDRVVTDGTALTLRVHPSLVEHLPEQDSRKIAAMPEVTLVRDETCAPAMIDAKWEQGGLFHDPDGLIEDVLRALRDETAPQEEMNDE